MLLLQFINSFNGVKALLYSKFDCTKLVFLIIVERGGKNTPFPSIGAHNSQIAQYVPV